MAGGPLTTTAVPLSTSLTLQSLNGLFAIYKKQGPTSADVLNKLKEVLLKGNTIASAVLTALIFLIVPVCLSTLEAGAKNPNQRKRKKNDLKMGHGGTLDSAASGVLGKLPKPVCNILSFVMQPEVCSEQHILVCTNVNIALRIYWGRRNEFHMFLIPKLLSRI